MKPSITLHSESKTGKLIKAFVKQGFKVSHLIQVQDGRLMAYMAGRGVRLHIDENGFVKFAGRFAKVA